MLQYNDSIKYLNLKKKESSNVIVYQSAKYNLHETEPKRKSKRKWKRIEY